MRRLARTDANQSYIVRALRQVGAKVAVLSGIGEGIPDLLVAFRGKWYVLEIKDELKPASARKLTKAEADWHQEFGSVAPVHVVLNHVDALKIICCNIET